VDYFATKARRHQDEIEDRGSRIEDRRRLMSEEYGWFIPFITFGGSIGETGLCDEESVGGIARDFGWERRRLAGIFQQLCCASFTIRPPRSGVLTVARFFKAGNDTSLLGPRRVSDDCGYSMIHPSLTRRRPLTTCPPCTEVHGYSQPAAMWQ
jgi:hypothetical protein